MAWSRVHSMKYDVALKMIDELNQRDKFVRLNQNQIRDIFQGFND